MNCWKHRWRGVGWLNACCTVSQLSDKKMPHHHSNGQALVSSSQVHARTFAPADKHVPQASATGNVDIANSGRCIFSDKC